jgi:hypothetical protein
VAGMLSMWRRLPEKELSSRPCGIEGKVNDNRVYGVKEAETYPCG